MTPDQLRSRYIALIKEGKAPPEAARIANAEAKRQPPKSETSVSVSATHEPPPVQVTKEEPPKVGSFEDMAWPDLRARAEEKAGRTINSRASAIAILNSK